MHTSHNLIYIIRSCYFTVSPTVEEYRKRLGLSSSDTLNLRMALAAVSEGNESALTELGMPPSAWNEISFMFTKLIKSGFIP